MQYGHGNGIGALLTIGIGVSAFAGWLYMCYPETAAGLADESKQSWSFLVLLGFVVVAVIGVSIAGSVLQHVMVLLRSLVQLSLIVALVVGGVMLWRREPSPSQSNFVDDRVSTPVISQTIETPPKKATKGRWWDQKTTAEQ